jgi:DNA-binding MarR family transcriptional regulator
MAFAELSNTSYPERMPVEYLDQSTDAPVTARDEVAFLLEEVTRNLRRAFEVRIQETGLNRSQWRLLVYLMRQEGQSQTELAACLDLERATVGQAIDRLEELGLLERRMCPSDRRVWHVYLKDPGRKLMPRLRLEADAVYDCVWKGAPPGSLQIFRDILREMASALK